MSDDAVVWKIGFGVLVLAFCGFTVALRKHPEPAPAAIESHAATVVPVSAASQLPPPAALPPASPVDVQDEPPPPRIEVVIEEAPAQRAPARAKPGRKPQRRLVAIAAAPPRHARRIERPRARRIVASAPQYPFDPRERWNPRF